MFTVTMDAEDAPAAKPGHLNAAQLGLARLSLAYVLDAIEISRDGADIVDRLLVAAILDANLGPVKQDASLQAAYAGVHAPPPQALFRPVSINAIAQSLGLPFETVRRRVARLVRAGACTSTAQGLVASQDHLGSAAFKAMSVARYERLKRFYFDLKAMDGLPPLRGRTAPAVTAEAPVRIANRILAEHLMRFIEVAMRRVGDPLAALVLLHMARANTEGVDISIGDPRALAAAARPVTNRLLGDLLNVSPETVRRRTAALTRAGYCRRTAEGFVARLEALDRPELVRLFAHNDAEVRRLFGDLDRFGVVAALDEDLATS
ncbi:MAG: hypothetical protein ACOY5Y_00275 [Pseudomonadota bacterium]